MKQKFHYAITCNLNGFNNIPLCFPNWSDAIPWRRLLGRYKMLSKFDIGIHKFCYICLDYDEASLQLFCGCKYLQYLWNQLKDYLVDFLDTDTAETHFQVIRNSNGKIHYKTFTFSFQKYTTQIANTKKLTFWCMLFVIMEIDWSVLSNIDI